MPGELRPAREDIDGTERTPGAATERSTRPSTGDEARRRIAELAAELDREPAVRLRNALEVGDDDGRDLLLADLAADVSQSRRDIADHAADTILDDHLRDATRRRLAERLAAEHPAFAEGIVAKMSHAEELGALARTLAPEHPALAQRALDRMPGGPERDAACEDAAVRMASRHPREAVAAVRTMSDAALASAVRPPARQQGLGIPGTVPEDTSAKDVAHAKVADEIARGPYPRRSFDALYRIRHEVVRQEMSRRVAVHLASVGEPEYADRVVKLISDPVALRSARDAVEEAIKARRAQGGD